MDYKKLLINREKESQTQEKKEEESQSTVIGKIMYVFAHSVSYIIRLFFALIIGAIIAAVVAFITEIIFDSDRVPSGYIEVVLDEPIEFDNKVKELGLKLYEKPENCVIKFKKVKDNAPITIDLSSILYYNGCYFTTQCIGTTDGKKYAITPGNSFNMEQEDVLFHINQCGASRKKGEVK